MSQLTDRLEYARTMSGLSKAALARRSGVHLRLVQKILAGERPRPSAHTLHRLATALGVSVEWVLGET